MFGGCVCEERKPRKYYQWAQFPPFPQPLPISLFPLAETFDLSHFGGLTPVRVCLCSRLDSSHPKYEVEPVKCCLMWKKDFADEIQSRIVRWEIRLDCQGGRC